MENIVDTDYVNKPNPLENNEMTTLNKANSKKSQK